MGKPDYRNIVYVCHPYQGKAENAEKAEEVMKKLTERYPNYLFLSGINSFGYVYFDTDYQRGLDMCLWLLDKCDEMWVYGDYRNSKGCMKEIEFCMEHHIPVKHKGGELS